MVNQNVYDKLVQVAKARKTVGYIELGRLADLSLEEHTGVKDLGAVLDAIADQELAAGRPLLPVVVVSERTGAPGAGLHRYAKRRGLQKTDDITFFASELKRVYDYWSGVSHG